MKIRLKNLKYSFKSLGVLIKAHPWFLVGQIISLLCLVVQTLIPINIVSLIVDAYEQCKSIGDIQKIVIVNILILIIVNLVNLIIDFLMGYINNHFTLTFSTVLFRKLESIDYDFHEQPSFLDNYTRALDNGAEKIYNVASNQMKLIKTLFQSVCVLSIIFIINKIAVIYALVISLIYCLLRRKRGELNYEKATVERPYNRKRWYIQRTYFVKDAIPDIKMTNINEVMLDEHKQLINNNLRIFKNYRTKIFIIDTIGSVMMSSIYVVVLGFVSYQMMKQKDYSQIAALTLAATTISNLLNNFSNLLTDIQIDAMETKVAFEVLDMTSTIESFDGIKVEEDFYQLRLDNLSFNYGEKAALKNVSMTINKGEKIAIVGTNGAGKTTLVKMLLRLYDPCSGSIYYNNLDYKQLNPKTLRKKVGAVFQNNEDYSVTIAENVLLRRIEKQSDRDLVVEALKFGDLYDYVMSLPMGIDTMVTREFKREGTIFSGGQRQKLAVSRGYAQNYQLFILDEPSSALDPIAETKMYHNMLELGRDKTLIFISHRLSATANVDKIYLFENGEIIESGSHAELMNIENGKYKELFNSQAEKYLGDDND